MEVPVEVGQIVAGKYAIERILARGGAGVVVKARHLQLLEPCAIKFMLRTVVATPLARERFLREARACARLKSDHIVKVFDVGELEDQTPYMVLEYLEGMDLEERVARGKPLPVAEAVGYVLQVCAGLAEAHALGIVHRDLKPGNVFLTPLGDGSTRVKILDFGISKELTERLGADQSRTQDGVILGSPLFMAPEQVRADEVDTRTDIWAVGVILYYLLTGIQPFEGRKITETLAFILTRPPEPPTAAVPAIPSALERLILRCLEKDPAGRPASVLDLATALAPFADDAGPTFTGRTSLTGRTSVAGRSSAVGATTIVGSASGADRPRRLWLVPAAVAAVVVTAALVALVAMSPREHPSAAAASASAPVAMLSATTTATPTAAPLPPPAPPAAADAGTADTTDPGTSPRASPRPPVRPAATGHPHAPAPSRGFDLGSRH